MWESLNTFLHLTTYMKGKDFDVQVWGGRVNATRPVNRSCKYWQTCTVAREVGCLPRSQETENCLSRSASLSLVTTINWICCLMEKVMCNHFFLDIASTKRVHFQKSSRYFLLSISGLGQIVALPTPNGHEHISYDVGVTQLNSVKFLSVVV